MFFYTLLNLFVLLRMPGRRTWHKHSQIALPKISLAWLNKQYITFFKTGFFIFHSDFSRTANHIHEFFALHIHRPPTFRVPARQFYDSAIYILIPQGIFNRYAMIPILESFCLIFMNDLHSTNHAPWHFLYFLPLPHGQGSLRPMTF